MHTSNTKKESRYQAVFAVNVLMAAAVSKQFSIFISVSNTVWQQ